MHTLDATTTRTTTRSARMDDYLKALAAARGNALVAEATSSPEEMPGDARYFLSETGLTGFGIVDGTLIGLFSLEKGGRAAVVDAIAYGAWRLDCFDGFLPGYYEGFGFVEVDRVANWTPGGPDVIFMALDQPTN